MLQGDTRNLPLQGLFQTLEMSQQEGVLTVNFQRMERYFALHDRTVTLIGEKPGKSPTLQNILAGLGILNRQEYDNVLSAMSSPSAPGDALIQCKLLTREQVLGPVREQVLERIYEIFEWRGARYRFEVKNIEPSRLLFSDPEIAHSMGFPVQGVLMEVARREDEWHRIRDAIPHSHQIYRIAGPKDQLASFTTPEIPDEQRMQSLLRLFDGEHPVTSVLNEAPVPAFYVFTILRTLIEKGFVTSVPLEEKKQLAESLRNRRQAGRMAEIYRSILEEDPEDDAIRRRLVLILEKKKENARELVEHYHALGENAGRRGDFEAQQQFVRRELEMAPRDLSVHEHAINVLGAGGDGRELANLLHGYFDQAKKSAQDSRAAEFLIGFAEDTPEKSLVFEQAGDLFARQGQGERAVEAYENSMRTSSSSARRTVVRRVAEKVRRFDARIAEKWLRRIGVDRRTKKRRISLPRVAAVLLLALLLTGGVHEWQAFSDRTEAVANAERLITAGDLKNARITLDEFRDSWRYSFAALDVEQLWTELTDGKRATDPVDTGGDPGTSPLDPPLDIDPDAPFDFERFISQGRSLRQNGDYEAALRHLLDVDAKLLPPAVRTRVVEERRELREYLARSSALAEEARRVEESGDRLAAGDLYLRLVQEYPYSPSARESSLPLTVDLLPENARLILEGRALPGPPYDVRLPGANLVELRAEAPGFTSSRLIIDPTASLDVTLHLPRLADWSHGTGAAVDARPATVGELVLVGGRDGNVVAWRAAEGTEAWRFPIEGIGDVVGGFTLRGDDVLFPGSDGAVYRLDSEKGKKVFRVALPGRGLPRGPLSEVGPDGTVFVVTSNGMVHCIDADEGRILWSTRVNAEGAHSPLRAGDHVLIASDSGEVVCLSASDGERLWQRNMGVGLATAVSATETLAIVGTRDQRLVALSITENTVDWEVPLDSTPVDRVAVDAVHAYVTTQEGGIVAIRTEDGVLAWRSVGHPGFRCAPRLLGDRLVTIDERGEVLVLRAEDGSPRWSYTCGAASGAPLGGDPARLVVVDSGPTLHVVPLETGSDETSSADAPEAGGTGRFAGR